MARKTALLALVFAAVLVWAPVTPAADAGRGARGAAVLNSVSPSHGMPQATVTVTGTGLGTRGQLMFGNYLLFPPPGQFFGTTGTVVSWTDTSIVCKVPELEAASLSVCVKHTELVGQAFVISYSNRLPFTIDTPPAPAISWISPSHALPGAEVLIHGFQLGTGSSGGVFFGTTPANVTSWTMDEIRCTVPDLPVGVTAVTVSRLGQTSPARAFTVDAPNPGWVRQDSRTTVSLSGVSFPDASFGWASGSKNTIIATANGGTTWTLQRQDAADLQLSLQSISFPDRLHGWAVGHHDFIYATANGGGTWTLQQSDAWQHMSTPMWASVSCPDATNGWAVGMGGAIVATTDGGTSGWGLQLYDFTAWLYGVDFPDATHGWAVGVDGIWVYSGGTWTPQHHTDRTLRAVSFPDALHGWAVGDGGTILMTADGGTNWTPQTSNTACDLYGVSFPDLAHGYAVGGDGESVVTSNGGATWTPCDTGTTSPLYGVSSPAAGHAWAVGQGGTVIAIGGGVVPDLTPPVTTAHGADAQWHRTAVTVTFTAVDEPGGSGMTGGSAKTEWSLDGGSWTEGTTCDVPAPADHTGDGEHAIAYRSCDAAGNLEETKTVTVRIDTTPPAVGASGVPADWTNAPVTVTLDVSDDGSGAGTAEYRLNGATSWTPYVSGISVTAEGTSNYDYRGSDLAGNVSDVQTFQVCIDTAPPSTRAYRATVRRFRTVTLHFRVADPAPGCGAAEVTLQILKGASVRVKIPLGRQATGESLTCRYRVRLKPATYTWRALAVDVAGNEAVAVHADKLIVR